MPCLNRGVFRLTLDFGYSERLKASLVIKVSPAPSSDETMIHPSPYLVVVEGARCIFHRKVKKPSALS